MLPHNGRTPVTSVLMQRCLLAQMRTHEAPQGRTPLKPYTADAIKGKSLYARRRAHARHTQGSVGAWSETVPNPPRSQLLVHPCCRARGWRASLSIQCGRARRPSASATGCAVLHGCICGFGSVGAATTLRCSPAAELPVQQAGEPHRLCFGAVGPVRCLDPAASHIQNFEGRTAGEHLREACPHGLGAVSAVVCTSRRC